MPKTLFLAKLERVLATITKQRQQHADVLAKIDTLFAKFGIKPSAMPPTVATPAETAAVQPMVKKSRRRRHFGQTGAEFVLGLLSGGKALPTAKLNAAWIQSGRPGNADTTLWLLAKKKMVKRTPRQDGPGSNYTAA